MPAEHIKRLDLKSSIFTQKTSPVIVQDWFLRKNSRCYTQSRLCASQVMLIAGINYVKEKVTLIVKSIMDY